MPYAHLDLFSGIGGFALAARNTKRIQTIQFVEIDSHCHPTLQKHFPDTPIHADITDFDANQNFDIITGGFPCQDLSTAKHNSEGLDGAKSGLWFEYLRLISEIKPSAIVIENVTPTKNKPWLHTVLDGVNQLGYNAIWRTFRACDFGLPHRRKRLFIIAFRQDVTPRNGLIFNQFFTYCPRLSAINKEILNSGSHRQILLNIAKYKQINVKSETKLAVKARSQVHALGNALIPAIAQSCFETVIKVLDANLSATQKEVGNPTLYKLQIPSNTLYLKHGLMYNGVIAPKTVLELSEMAYRHLLRSPMASDAGRGRNGGRLSIGLETLRREAYIGSEGYMRKYQQSLVHNVADALNAYPSVNLYEYMMGFPNGWTSI